jgi:hypothetical protein
MQMLRPRAVAGLIAQTPEVLKKAGADVIMEGIQTRGISQ